jgi:hypothetical protein
MGWLLRLVTGICAGLVEDVLRYFQLDHTRVLAELSKQGPPDMDFRGLFVGYCIGGAALAVLGAAAAVIFASRQDNLAKVFAIGFSAPAALGGLLPSSVKADGWFPDFSIVTPAHADDCVGDGPVLTGLKVFFGAAPDKSGLYRVVAGSYKDPKVAATKAKELASTDATVKASVGPRRCGSDYYPVVVGDPLPLDDAKKKLDAVKKIDSVPPDAYLSPVPATN